MNSSLFSLLFGATFGLLMPIVLLVWWKKKTKVKIRPFIVGVVCFTVFAQFLESFAHQYFLLSGNAISSSIMSSPTLYTLYACFAAGIFEETGRFVGIKYFINEPDNKADAVTYGIGHGGIEVVNVLVVTYVVYALALMGLNLGAGSQQVMAIANTVTFGNVLLSLLERISAMTLHIGLSMVVYCAVKNTGKFYLYPLAVLIHALSDVPAALYQFGVLQSIVFIELVILVIAILTLIFGIKVLYKEN